MLDVIIAKRDIQADGIAVFDLISKDRSPLPSFDGGAHIDVEISPGLVRQYSLCGDPADRSRYRLGILRDPKSRGGSSRLHEVFLEGRMVRIGPPRNLFPLESAASQTILVGGGIGITPLIAMAYSLDRLRKDFVLHYCAREPAKAAFLQELRDAPFADRVRMHFDSDGEAARFSFDQDLPEPQVGIHLYVCGPDGFMTWMREGALERGYPAAQLHQEFFSSQVDASGSRFDVVLASSGTVVEVAEGQSIVQALAAVGVKVTVSCEQGVCGTCLCNVLEGEPDHRDVYLTDEEKADNDQILLCCSRARSPTLVLDL